MNERNDVADIALIGSSGADSPKTTKVVECLNCPALFAVSTADARQASKRYCSDKCRDKAGNRNALQGKAVMALLKAWRLSRNSKARRGLGARCLTEVSVIVDRFIDLDRREGRGSEKLFAAAEHLLALGPYIDRERAPLRRKRDL